MKILHGRDTAIKVFIYPNEFYCLENFSAFKIYWQGILFATSEQAYQWEKFPKQDVVREQIINAMSAHQAFKIAQENDHLRDPNWLQRRVPVMRDILAAKLRQHEYVRRKLFETGDRLIVEDSWRDDFWGAGADGTGQNMLGRLWMQHRELLQKKPDAFGTLDSVSEVSSGR